MRINEEKWNFEPIASSAHTAEFLVLGKHSVSTIKLVWGNFFQKNLFMRRETFFSKFILGWSAWGTNDKIMPREVAVFH